MPVTAADMFFPTSAAAGYISENGMMPPWRPRSWSCVLCGRVNRPGPRAGVPRREPPPHCTGCGISAIENLDAHLGRGIWGAVRFAGVDRWERWT